MHASVRRYTYICMSPLHKTIKREQYFEIKQMVCSDGDPIPSGNHLALLCNGYRCCMQRDQNGNFPPVTTNQICVCCKKPLHPICGLIHERTSFLTCLLCHEQFGRAFESPESPTAYTSAKETTEQVPGGGQDEMDSISVGEEVGEGEGVGVSLARARMVQELKKQMTPANCRKENRAISTRMKNESEACGIVVWLYGLKNDEDYETKKRLKALIDERLLLQIGLQIDGIVGEKKESKKIKAVRAATKAWLDVEENPAPPFAFSGFTYTVIDIVR